MKLFSLFSALLFAAFAENARSSADPTELQRKEASPTGKLRVGVVSAPAQSAFFVIQEASGEPRGVTVDLGREFARQLGVPVEFFVVSSSGQLVDALSSGALDVAFMPMDAERRERVDFGPTYFTIESTYLVRADSGIQSLSDVDHPNVRVVGIANTATIRAAGHSLKHTTIVAVKSVGEATEMLRANAADAFALTHDALPALAARLPGSRILDGNFLQTGIAIAVPKNRPNALAYATTFIEEAKASGLVRRAFDDAGLRELVVAPPSAK
jgi:polar amino acid transport system substrate-binding protein